MQASVGSPNMHGFTLLIHFHTLPIRCEMQCKMLKSLYTLPLDLRMRIDRQKLKRGTIKYSITSLVLPTRPRLAVEIIEYHLFCHTTYSTASLASIYDNVRSKNL